MAYIDKEQVADIRARLKEAFPLAHGWKFSVRMDGHSALRVNVIRSPLKFTAYDFEPYSHDDDKPRSSLQAKMLGRTVEQTSGDINHYWFRETYEPETVAVLEKIVGIVMRDHWDDSDIQTDYFNCAWYQSFGIGKDWRTDVEPASPEQISAFIGGETWKEIRAERDRIKAKDAA